jgi:L-lysine 2,3-aminomutase
MASDDVGSLVTYLDAHPEVTSVLVTGGDPMIMGEPVLRRYLEPLLDPSLEHLESIRIGTKSLAYWPQRYVSDPDADATLRLFEETRAAGRTLAFMAHFSHPRELEPPIVGEAVRRIRDASAVIHTQAPLIRTINDDPATWSGMWRTQTRMGMVPYYMFVERDTGPQDYFAVRWPGRTRSFVTPTPRCRGCAGPCGARQCRPRRARCAWTGCPRWPGRRCSCCT